MTFNINASLRSAALFATICAFATPAAATPMPLTFTYPYETLPAGAAEIEQYVDATYVRIPRSDASPAGGTTFGPRYALQTELEYGLTDRLELGLYLVFAQDAAPGPSLKFDGTKERLRLRLGEAGNWPVDVALYFELAQFHDELEVEEKILLSRRFGKLRVLSNLWIEQSVERGRDGIQHTYNPTLGVTYEIHPSFHVGLEYWVHGHLGGQLPSDATDVDRFNAKPHHFLGPALMVNFGRVWWTTGVYGRLDHLGRSGEVGDEFGKLWVRSIVGIDL